MEYIQIILILVLILIIYQIISNINSNKNLKISIKNSFGKIPKRKRYEFESIEVYYSLYDENTTNKSIELANKYNLKYSGGSDYHGYNKPDIQLGIGKGNLVIPNKWVKDLKK